MTRMKKPTIDQLLDWAFWVSVVSILVLIALAASGCASRGYSLPAGPRGSFPRPDAAVDPTGGLGLLVWSGGLLIASGVGLWATSLFTGIGKSAGFRLMVVGALGLLALHLTIRVLEWAFVWIAPAFAILAVLWMTTMFVRYLRNGRPHSRPLFWERLWKPRSRP